MCKAMTLNNSKKQWDRARRKSIPREIGRKGKYNKRNRRNCGDVVSEIDSHLLPRSTVTSNSLCCVDDDDRQTDRQTLERSNQSILLSIYRQLCVLLSMTNWPCSSIPRASIVLLILVYGCAQLLCVDMNKLRHNFHLLLPQQQQQQRQE